MPKRITTAEAADLLGVTRQHVAQLVASGELPAIEQPFGPGTRFIIEAAAVAKRVKAKEAGAIKPGPKAKRKPGRPKE